MLKENDLKLDSPLITGMICSCGCLFLSHCSIVYYGQTLLRFKTPTTEHTVNGFPDLVCMSEKCFVVKLSHLWSIRITLPMLTDTTVNSPK